MSNREKSKTSGGAYHVKFNLHCNLYRYTCADPLCSYSFNQRFRRGAEFGVNIYSGEPDFG